MGATKHSYTKPFSSVLFLNFKSLLYSLLFPTSRLPAAGEQMEQNSKQIFSTNLWVSWHSGLLQAAFADSFLPISIFFSLSLQR